MIRVTVDASPILPKPSGVGFYVVKLLEGLTRLALEEGDVAIDPLYQISLKNALKGKFSAPEILTQYSNLRYFPLPVKATNLFLQYPWLFLPIVERSFGLADIFHGTNYTVFPCRKSRKVMTIYDLTFIKYPQFTDSVVARYGDRVRRCLKWTDLVLTISESSKRDIVEYLGFPSDRIVVTPLASRYELDYKPQVDQNIGYDLGQPYILFVSTIEPRKNIVGLIDAFDELKRKQNIPHNLVLVGQKGWRYEAIFERIERSPYRDNIYHLNYLSNDAVAMLYRQAELFIYPSHYEGFGLPVLEAMTLGTPVVCSDNSSLPEVAGDAALYVNCEDISGMAEAMARIIGDSKLRQSLIDRGRQQAAQFSWMRTAKETLQAYRTLSP
jgi:glycosyltransferase involved in cell wall biosynthesis